MSRIVELAGATGKWKIPGVPHKGWVCEGTKDLRDDKTVCEMCETAQIRFAHYMSHADYDETLVCGVVCAGHMSEDYQGSREREARLRSDAGQRKRWLTRQWKLSSAEHPYINAKGFNVVVFKRKGKYSFRIKRLGDGEKPRFADPLYPREDAAKLAAFDAIIVAERAERTGEVF